MGEEYEAAEDKEGGEEKPDRRVKGKKKKKTVHAHVEAHIPLQLAPGAPKLDFYWFPGGIKPEIRRPGNFGCPGLGSGIAWQLETTVGLDQWCPEVPKNREIVVSLTSEGFGRAKGKVGRSHLGTAQTAHDSQENDL